MDGVLSYAQAYEMLEQLKTFIAEDEALPAEVITVLKTFGDGQQGNNDVETTLVEIRDSLMYDTENTALYELSSRLEVIDTRLDLEFECINFGIGLIASTLLAMASWRFLSCPACCFGVYHLSSYKG